MRGLRAPVGCEVVSGHEQIQHGIPQELQPLVPLHTHHRQFTPQTCHDQPFSACQAAMQPVYWSCGCWKAKHCCPASNNKSMLCHQASDNAPG